MYRTMTLSAYDCLDQVVINLKVLTYGDDQDVAPVLVKVSTQVRGSGEEDSRQWAVDQLVAMLETL